MLISVNIVVISINVSFYDKYYL